MADNFLNLTGLTRFKNKLDNLFADKQDLLVSGANIKTLNGKSILGDGDIEIAYTAIYGTTTFTDLLTALSGDKAVIIKDIPYNGDNITVLVNWWGETSTGVEIDSITIAQKDLCDVDITVSSANSWTATFANRDPFMLLDFNQPINVSIPYCTEDIANTAIPNVDVNITNEMGVNWAIASLAKYEVKDSSGARINCWPVCQFSMNGQKTLRLRMMCAGTSRKTAASINGAILLKHR